MHTETIFLDLAILLFVFVMKKKVNSPKFIKASVHAMLVMADWMLTDIKNLFIYLFNAAFNFLYCNSFLCTGHLGPNLKDISKIK